MKNTLFDTFPRAAVNQLHQHARHVMRAQHAIDDTDAVEDHGRNRQLQINTQCEHSVTAFHIVVSPD